MRSCARRFFSRHRFFSSLKNQSDTSLFRWLDQGAANVVDGATWVVSSSSSFVNDSLQSVNSLTSSGLRSASSEAKHYLPQAHIPIPKSLRSSTKLVKDASALAKQTADSGTSTISDAGQQVGSQAVSALRHMIVSDDQVSSAPSSSKSAFISSLFRLGSTSLESVGSITAKTAALVSSLTSESIDSAIDLLRHSAGDDVADATSDLLAVKKDYVAAMAGFAALLDSKKVAKRLLKSAGKSARDEARKSLQEAAARGTVFLFDVDDSTHFLSPAHEADVPFFDPSSGLRFASISAYVNHHRDAGDSHEEHMVIRKAYQLKFTQSLRLREQLLETAPAFISEKRFLDDPLGSIEEDQVNLGRIIVEVRTGFLESKE